MTTLAVKVYEAFKDDEKKARVLAEAFDELEARTSPLRDVATKGDLEVTKLALQKEIEEVRLTLQKEIEEVRLTLQKEIEEVRKEIEKVRLGLQKEIEEVRRRIEEVRADLIKWVAALLIIQGGVIVSLIKLL